MSDLPIWEGLTTRPRVVSVTAKVFLVAALPGTAPLQMAHTPLKMTISEAQLELDRAWMTSYSPQNNEKAIDWFQGSSINDEIMHFIMRMFFRGIYFPQRNAGTWMKSIAQNHRPILKLVREGFGKYREARNGASTATGIN